MYFFFEANFNDVLFLIVKVKLNAKEGCLRRSILLPHFNQQFSYFYCNFYKKININHHFKNFEYVLHNIVNIQMVLGLNLYSNMGGLIPIKNID